MRVFTIVGPAESGKTTLARALMDLDATQGARQETAPVAVMQPFLFMAENWAVIDVAGGAENLAQVGPTLTASDAAVFCVSADPEVAVLAAPYLRQIEQAGIPALLFINRVDQAQGRIADCVAALQSYSAQSIVLRQVPIRAGRVSAEQGEGGQGGRGQVVGAIDLISERAWRYIEGQPSALIELPQDMLEREQEARSELLEALADFDDPLLQELIGDRRVLPAVAYDVVTRLLRRGAIIPALLGAAEQGNGVLRLMKALRHEVPHGEVNRMPLSDPGGDMNKVVAIGRMAARRQEQRGVPGLQPGHIGRAIKSDHLNLGYFYSVSGSGSGSGSGRVPDWAQPRPSTYRRLVIPVHERDEARLAVALGQVVSIDPLVQLDQHSLTGRALLHLQGPLHLRRVLMVLETEFGVEAVGERVPPAFRITISRAADLRYRLPKQSGGAGQFAEVKIEITPLPRGTGIQFRDAVRGGTVPKPYITAVEAGVREALRIGCDGHPVVDVAVQLHDGKHHVVDSSDYAFRMAGQNATRLALEKAGTVLLQPIHKVTIHVPSVFSGALIPVMSSLKGQLLGRAPKGNAAGWDVLEALLPLTAQDALGQNLASATRATGWFESELDHYAELRDDDFGPD